MIRVGLLLSLLAATAFAQAPAECSGNTCTVGQRGNDIILGGQVKFTVGPLGDGGSVYVEPLNNGVPLVIRGTQSTGDGGTGVPDVIIGSKNTRIGSGSIVSFRNGLNEVFAVNAAGAVGTASASNGSFGYLDAGVARAGYLQTYDAPPGLSGTAPVLIGSRSAGTAGFWMAARAVLGTASTLNYTLISDATDNYWNTPTAHYFCINNSCGLSWSGTTLASSAGTSDFAVHRMSAKIVDSSTAPTLGNGCTSPSVTWNTGTALFQFDVGTSCTGISAITVTLPAATNGWGCTCTNVGAATNVRQSGGTTTTAVITNYGTSVATPADWTDGADIKCQCRGG